MEGLDTKPRRGELIGDELLNKLGPGRRDALDDGSGPLAEESRKGLLHVEPLGRLFKPRGGRGGSADAREERRGEERRRGDRPRLRGREV